MVQIIEENRKPSLSDRFGRAFAKAAEVIPDHFDKRMKMDAENEALASQGIDLKGISDPETRKLILAADLRRAEENDVAKNKQSAADKLKLGKEQETQKTFKDALSRLQKMKDLRKKGNLGRGSGIKSMFGGDTGRDFGAYEQLGKSLISFVSTIPIRNRNEFEVMAEGLYDPTVSDAEAEGILNAMQNILEQGTAEDSMGQEQTPLVQAGVPTGRPKPAAWDSKASAQQNQNKPITLEIIQDLFRKTGGDKQKARQMALDMGYKI